MKYQWVCHFYAIYLIEMASSHITNQLISTKYGKKLLLRVTIQKSDYQ